MSLADASYASLSTSGTNLHKSSSATLMSRSGNVSRSIHSRVPRAKYPFLKQNQQQQQHSTTSSLNKRVQDFSSSNLSEIDLESELNRPTCSPDLRIDESIGYRQETKIQFVVDAVYAFAEALHAAWLDLCRSKDRVCKELKELDGGVFYKDYLLKVNFSGELNVNSFFFLLFSLLWLVQVPFLPPYIASDSSGPSSTPLEWEKRKRRKGVHLRPFILAFLSFLLSFLFSNQVDVA